MSERRQQKQPQRSDVASSSVDSSHLSLDAFRKANPENLGPVAFVKWANGTCKQDKQFLHSKYQSLISGALASTDIDTQNAGKKMQELWDTEKRDAPLRRLRRKNIISAAKRSSLLQRALDQYQYKKTLEELDLEEYEEQQKTKQDVERQCLEEDSVDISDDEDSLSAGEIDEVDSLITKITSVKHQKCDEWVLDGECVACLVDEYQKPAIDALRSGGLKKSEPADIMILAGTFAPWNPTERMIRIFNKHRLKKIRNSMKKKLDTIQLDDGCIQKAIRHRNNEDIEDAVQSLDGLTDTRLKTLFRQMIEELPDKEQEELAEETLITNYVSPILRTFAHNPTKEILAHFSFTLLVSLLPTCPNTNSRTQKRQGLEPHRPDFKVVIGDKESSFGEVTGPKQKNDKRKNGWDLFRLSKFGTALLNEGVDVVPLVQVIADCGTVYRHIVKIRGISVLAQVGIFTVPISVNQLGALQASLPVLFWLRGCLAWLEEHPQSLRRSWTRADLEKINKYLK
ncbi:hypothetical protein BGX26_004508 [Mortierella sp. AD094]|nr:hypothetical protein BGX26_004508 [Mortierella sp. AD094]